MDFTLNARAFLQRLPLTKMSGQEKFVAMAGLTSRGVADAEINTGAVREVWLKSQLGVAYNPAFYVRAQEEGWVDPVPKKKATFKMTEAGFDHLSALPELRPAANSHDRQQAGGLSIFNRKATHTFDKYLRGVLAPAKSAVWIADAWVDETVFDNVLDVIPRTVSVRLIYSQARGNFAARAKRFATQYPQFGVRRYKPLHDRFMVVDEKAYVLGPSIKDAATNSPALVVELHANEKRLLRNFFDDLWRQAKAEP